jgi:hypothetical protein
MKNRKKKIVAAAVTAVCVVAGLAVILHNPNDVSEPIQTTEANTAEITVEEIKTEPKNAVTTENSAEEEPLDEPNAEAESTDVTDENQVEEIVQNFTEATKPEPPAPPEIPTEQATNPSAPPTYAPEQTVREITTTAPKSEIPQGGEKKNGQIFIPGFGWVKDEGGGAKSSPATGMKENGNKIGTFG